MARTSVVMPCYNAERFLERAIRSVLGQTDGDFELIIVDDGSTDSSARVIGSFGDGRIIYLRQDNAGPARARNTGSRLATGEFIAYLDADDQMLPGRLAMQRSVLEADPTLSVVGSGYVWVDEGDRELPWPYHSWRRAPDLNNIASWLFDCPFVPSAVMLRRQAWEDVGGFDEELVGPEDWNFWMRLVVTGHRMTWHQEVVCLYRRSAGSLSEDAERMSVNCPEALQRVLDRPDFPPDLLPLGRQALAVRYIDGAKRLYRSGMWDQGRAELEQAIRLDPDLIVHRRGLPSNLEDEIVTGALDPLVQDPFAYLDAVLYHLPANAGPVDAIEGQVMPRTHLELFIRSLQGRSYGPAFRSHLPHLLRYPRWVVGYGSVMISARAIAKRIWRSAPGRRVPA